MDENGIKAAVLTRIRREANGCLLPIVANEFSLNGTGIRADLAVLGDGFCGYEIKSATDTLRRLPRQMDGYARYFDRTILMVAPKHLPALREIDLQGAEVWYLEGTVEWQRHRAGTARTISGQWLQHLLTVEEERRSLRAIEALLAEVPSVEIDVARRAEFEATFSRRYAETSATFWEAVRDREILTDDLKLLSRFHANRQVSREIEQRRAERWAGWASAVEALTSDFQPSQSSSVSSTASRSS